MQIKDIINESLSPNIDKGYAEYLATQYDGLDYTKALAHAWKQTFGETKGNAFKKWAYNAIENADNLDDEHKQMAGGIVPNVSSRWGEF